MLNNENINNKNAKGENDMAVLQYKVNQIQELFSMRSSIINIKLNLFESILKFRNVHEETICDKEIIEFNLDELSADELQFLNTYEMMLEEQDDFAQNVPYISYEGILKDE
ncbi:hypothetical protein ACTPC6_11385 [Clostridioides difficile]